MTGGIRSVSPLTGGNTSPDNTSFPLDNHHDEVQALSEVASLNAAHKFIMDAMLRQQKQYFEQCTSNWMSVQRSDNNCLSKSKAERYRWCVGQGNDAQTKSSRSSASSNSHVSNLKKSASMAGVGVTPVQDKLYSTVFTGASKFCCRDCGNPFNTLVELTVHMNKTGHFRDANGTEKSNTSDDGHHSNSAKVKKRSILDEDIQSEKVLSCMGCGDMFESLQDLSVHMMKTKHYEYVPSLRMWKQDSSTDSLPPPKKRSLQSVPTYGKKSDAPTSTPSEVNPQSRSSLYPPSLISGINNPTAAYSNLLYPSPWLGSSAASQSLPSLLAGANGLSYPFGYFSGIFPGSFLPPPAASLLEKKEELHLDCSQCNESFNSIQKLTEHIQETSHFPAMGAQWLNLLSGLALPTSRSATSTSSTSEKSTSSAQTFSNTFASGMKKPSDYNSRKMKFDANSPQSDTSRDYIQSCRKDNKEKKNDSFDFIKSLESTIQSAISKVKSPHDEKAHFRKNQSNAYDIPDRHRFSPFVSSIKNDSSFFGDMIKSAHSSTIAPLSCEATPLSRRKCTNDDEAKSKYDNRHSDDNHENLFKQTSICNTTEDQNTSIKCKLPTVKHKTDKPLDLTVKRDATSTDCQSAESRTPSAGQANPRKSPGISSATKTNTDIFSTYNGRSLGQNPLQSLQSLFELMKPRIEAAASQVTSSQNSSSKNRLSPEPYRPLMMTSDSNSTSSNPLQEMLKIVNKTDLEKTKRSEDKSQDLYLNRKRSSGESSPVDSKKSKLSMLLHDLVVPKSESKSNENPLQMMQDLVDNKLNPSSRTSQQSQCSQQSAFLFNKHSKSSSPEASDVDVKVPSATSAPSKSSHIRGHHQQTETNGICKRIAASSGEPSNRSSSPRSSSPRSSSPRSTSIPNKHSDLTELTLEIAFADLLGSAPSASHPDDDLILNLSKRTGLPINKIKDWFKNTHDALQSRGELPFFRGRDNDKNPTEFICSRCGAVFACSKKFSAHLEEHIVQSNAKRRHVQSTDYDVTSRINHRGSTTRDIENGKESPGNGKFTIQGSMCFGSYPTPNGISDARVGSSSPHSEEEESATLPVADGVIRVKQLPHLHHSRCPDKVESSDDVITVTS